MPLIYPYPVRSPQPPSVRNSLRSPSPPPPRRRCPSPSPPHAAEPLLLLPRRPSGPSPPQTSRSPPHSFALPFAAPRTLEGSGGGFLPLPGVFLSTAASSSPTHLSAVASASSAPPASPSSASAASSPPPLPASPSSASAASSPPPLPPSSSATFARTPPPPPTSSTPSSPPLSAPPPPSSASPSQPSTTGAAAAPGSPPSSTCHGNCVVLVVTACLKPSSPASSRCSGPPSAARGSSGDYALVTRKGCFFHIPPPTKNEIEQRAEDMPASSQHPSLQPAYNFPSANVQSNSFSFGNVAAALNSQMGQTDQTRIVGISNALSNPLRQAFHSNHLVQCSGYGPINSLPNGNGARNNHSPQNQDFMHCNSYEPSMDMNHDAP